MSGLSGADLEYQRLLTAAGQSSSTAVGKDGASLEREADQRFVDLGGFSGGGVIPPADTVTPGKVQLSTDIQATGGTDNTTAMTPQRVAQVVAGKANDASVVHNTGNEAVAGVKTFSSAPVVPAGSFAQDRIVSLVTDLSDIRNDVSAVQGDVGSKQAIDKVYYDYTTSTWPARPVSSNPITWVSTKGVVATAPPGSAVDGDSWKVTPGQDVLI